MRTDRKERCCDVKRPLPGSGRGTETGEIVIEGAVVR